MSRVTTEWHGDAFKAHMQKAVEAGLQQAGIVVQAEMIRRLGQNASPSPIGSAPGVDTGRLRRSITVERESGLSVVIGTNLAYGRYLEFGARPTAKRVKFLPVPLTREAKMAQRRVGSVRQIPGLKAIKTPRGMFLVKHKGGKRARVEFWFVLKKSVQIRPRPWLRPSLDAALPRAQAKLRDTVAQAIGSFRAGGAAA